MFHERDIEDFLISDHILAYEYVIDKYHKPLTADEICTIHSILMNNVFRLQKIGDAGEYRKNPVYIGPKYGIQEGGIIYKQISKAMKNLEKDIANLYPNYKQTENILQLHNEFEIIHPFNDGNGRTGRLILNWLSLKHMNQFITIDSKKRKEYYTSIKTGRQDYIDKHPEIKFYKDRSVKQQFIDPMFLISCSKPKIC